MPRKPAQDGLFGDLLPENALSMGVSGNGNSTSSLPGVGAATVDDEVQSLATQLPKGLYLGTSSWFFPGWAGLVYDRKAAEPVLSREGLSAYGKHPLFRSVGIDRTFYAPIEAAQFQRYAAQVPPHFRFLVKAPAVVTDAFKRDPKGRTVAPNPGFLDAAWATEQFIVPALQGLGGARDLKDDLRIAHTQTVDTFSADSHVADIHSADTNKAGPLVFQFSPLGRGYTDEPARFAERLDSFFAQLPKSFEGTRPLYAVEFRDAALVHGSIAQVLKAHGVAYCVGLHASMPKLAQQLPMLRALWPAPLVVRWSLNQSQGRALRYEAAKSKYEPFDKLVDEDLVTRQELADLAKKVLGAKERVFVIINNKAEGSAPLSLVRLLQAMLQDTP
jgi:uncharacterized protein YecE (DUF72 family)